MIVTHTSPDLDAIASVWLLKRFGNMENEPVGFVNTGNPDQEMLSKAKAVVDTSKVHNEATLRQNPGGTNPRVRPSPVCRGRSDRNLSYRLSLPVAYPPGIRHNLSSRRLVASV